MAEANRSILTLEPERKLAKALLFRHGLQPPINIEEVVLRYAVLEVAAFPTTCDCLLIRKPAQRPHLIISLATKQNENRYRFTLAHELGHLIIPWQSGSIFCHTDFSVQISDELTASLEAEANRFASELLVPSDWAAAQVDSGAGPLSEQVVELARRAGVSPITAMLTAARVLPPDHLFVIFHEDIVAYVALSPGSTMNAPYRGMNIGGAAAFMQACSNVGGQCSRAKLGPLTLIATRFPPSVPFSANFDLKRLSTDLLREILTEIAPEPLSSKKIVYSVNGIIGSANNSALNNEESLYRLFLQRFVARPELARLVSHPRFNEFLAIKARELCAKKRIQADNRSSD